jgi:hypothetical protein
MIGKYNMSQKKGYSRVRVNYIVQAMEHVYFSRCDLRLSPEAMEHV